MNIKKDSKGKEEEEEITLPVVAEAQAEPCNEQSPSNVVRVLNELAPEEDVAESTSGIESEPFEAGSFIFEPNKKVELPA